MSVIQFSTFNTLLVSVLGWIAVSAKNARKGVNPTIGHVPISLDTEVLSVMVFYALFTAAVIFEVIALWHLTGDPATTMSATVIVMIVFLFLFRSLRYDEIWRFRLWNTQRQLSKPIRKSTVTKTKLFKNGATNSVRNSLD